MHKQTRMRFWFCSVFYFFKIELEQKRNCLKNLLNNFALAWKNKWNYVQCNKTRVWNTINVNSRRKTPTILNILRLFYTIYTMYIIHNINSKHNIHNKEIMFNKVSDERWDSLSKINIMSVILSKIPSKRCYR